MTRPEDKLCSSLISLREILNDYNDKNYYKLFSKL